jgi:predicted small metal-binding protein
MGGGKYSQDIHRLSTELAELKIEFEHIKTQHKLRLSEWEDLYDKITRQVERMRKRSLGLAPPDEFHPGAPPSNQEPNRHAILRELKEKFHA